MTETANTHPQKTSLALLEPLSKAAALILFVIYISGFIIVSVHNASYGFVELSPFKPRILSAGALFATLVLIPVFSAHFAFGPTDSLNLSKWLSRSWIYLIGCAVASMVLSPIYTGPPANMPKQPWWTIAILVFVGVIWVVATIIAISHHEKLHWALAGVLPPVLLYLAFESRTAPSDAMTLWFFGIGLTSTVIHRNVQKHGLNVSADLIFPFVIALSFFPSYLYPRIKFSWGGGQPTPVVIYFSQDYRLLPDQQIEGQLLDESDSGYYVLLTGQDKALYVPRNGVTAIFFSQLPINLGPSDKKAKP